MEQEEIVLGSHVSMASPDFYLGSVKTALSWGENGFMFYTGAPQNTRRLPVSSLKIEEGRALLREHHIADKNILVHAPYIINLANLVKPSVRELALSFLKEELDRVAAFSVPHLVLHPGSSLGEEKGKAIQAIAEGLDEVLEESSSSVTILLETMAGKGSEVGSSFEEIAAIISSSRHQDRLACCLDTCHIHDAGYREDDIDSILEEFDAKIGLSRLKAIHLNDSKNPRASHKDRHENIGYGDIGFATLYRYVHHPKLLAIPKYLETPYVGEKAPYAKEIEMLRSGKYIENWKDTL